MDKKVYDVIILGSGPAGLTAGLYASRSERKTLLIAGSKWGGQLQLTTLVENYPGFPQGIQGPDLMLNMREQAKKFGTEIVDADFTKANFSKKPFEVEAGGQIYLGRTIIIATGADTKWLEVPGEEKFLGKGVSSCAPCDAFFYKGKKVIVVGGGDSAMEEALVLTKFATEVTIIHRRGEFRASQIMQDRVLKHPKIKVIWDSEIKEVLGEQRISGVKLETKGKGVWQMPINGVFVAVGHEPNTQKLSGINLDEKGFVRKRMVFEGSLVKYHNATNIDGVFTAGDVFDYRYKQVITAAASGCMAALDVEKYLEENH